MSLENLPLELKDQIFSYILPPDRLALSQCSSSLHEAVSCTHLKSPRASEWKGYWSIIFFEYDNDKDIYVNLAKGVVLKVRESPESRQSAIGIRQRMCDKLTVKKVYLKNVSILNLCMFVTSTNDTILWYHWFDWRLTASIAIGLLA